jgi:hypothetical protein
VLRNNKAVQKAVVSKMAKDRREMLQSLFDLVDQLVFWHKELKVVLYELQSSCDQFAWACDQAPRAKTCSIFELEEMLESFVSQLGKDIECKRSILKDLEELSQDPARFDSGTHDELLIYLSVWSERPYMDVGRLAEMETILLGEAE